MVNYCTFFSLLEGDYGYLIFSVPSGRAYSIYFIKMCFIKMCSTCVRVRTVCTHPEKFWYIFHLHLLLLISLFYCVSIPSSLIATCAAFEVACVFDFAH